MSQQETPLLSTWGIWALLSAGFAALTAVFAKVGVERMDPDLATLIRTIVILLVLSGIVLWGGKYRLIAAASPRTYLFLVLSGIATGASWLCYFRALHLGDAARVAPIDKLSVVHRRPTRPLDGRRSPRAVAGPSCSGPNYRAPTWAIGA
jgi:transporter family protein